MSTSFAIPSERQDFEWRVGLKYSFVGGDPETAKHAASIHVLVGGRRGTVPPLAESALWAAKKAHLTDVSR